MSDRRDLMNFGTVTGRIVVGQGKPSLLKQIEGMLLETETDTYSLKAWGYSAVMRHGLSKQEFTVTFPDGAMMSGHLGHHPWDHHQANAETRQRLSKIVFDDVLKILERYLHTLWNFDEQTHEVSLKWEAYKGWATAVNVGTASRPVYKYLPHVSYREDFWMMWQRHEASNFDGGEVPLRTLDEAKSIVIGWIMSEFIDGKGSITWLDNICS